MNDRGEELIQRAAELKAESAQLKADSDELAGWLAQTWRAGARERRPAPVAAGTRGAYPAGTGPKRGSGLPASGASRGYGIPGGDGTGDVPVTRPGPWPGTGILDEDEAVALAVLLEDLAARHGPDLLRGPALQAAALLRQRVAARQWRGIRPGSGGPASRRESGDTRDDDADHRDSQATQRDCRAGERDDRAKGRDCQADAADGRARGSEQQMRGRLRAAELRDQAAVERAAAPPPADAGRRQWQLDREAAEADLAHAGDDREAIREMLAQACAARQAAWRDRYADGQDRVAARRDRGAAHADRQGAACDRQAARADRDQAVIDSEEEDLPPGD